MASEPKVATTFEEGLKGASEKVAEFQDEKTALKRLQHWLHQTPSAVPMIVLVVANAAATLLRFVALRLMMHPRRVRQLPA